MTKALTQLHGLQLRDVPHDEQEVGVEPPVGVQEQEAQLPVPVVRQRHALLGRHVEAPLLWTETKAEGGHGLGQTKGPKWPELPGREGLGVASLDPCEEKHCIVPSLRLMFK